MYRIAILFLLFSHQHEGRAQSVQLTDTPLKSTPGVFLLPAHKHLNEVAWRDSIYLFPSFHYGRITFATGYSPEDKVLMNYDLYFDQMTLITKDGDTTQVTRIKEVKLITIGDKVFLHDHKIGYVEIVLQLPVSLGVLSVMNIVHMEYVSGPINIYKPFADTRGTPSDYDRYYTKGKSYYFVDRDNKVHKATRATILKLFRKNKDEIDVYLGENGIDFENKNDLVKLLLFCHEQEVKNHN